MDFITNLAVARNQQGTSNDRFKALEVLFKQVCGNCPDGTISLAQFQKIVRSKNPFFVERIFTIFDKEKSNAISKDEFFIAVKDVISRTEEQKMRLLFQIYDIDGNNAISLIELQHVITCCMEENGLSFSDLDLQHLTLILFEDADSDSSGTISFTELMDLFTRKGLVGNVSASMERWLLPQIPGEGEEQVQQSMCSKLFGRKMSLKYIANNANSYAFFVVFLAISSGLFIARLFSYADEGPLVMFARACGQCLNFTCAFTLLLMLRKSITVLRSSGLSEYLPLDQHIYYHKVCGWFILVYSSTHATLHCVHFVGESHHSNAPYLEFLFSHHLNIGWIDGETPITGWCLLMVLFVMILSSLPFVRHSGNFEVFYYCHLLYVAFYVLLIIHAEHFWMWFIVPGIIFAVEVLIRFIHSFGSHGYTYVQQGVVLPSRVIHLVIKRPPNFDYRPGDWVFVQIPEIAKAEWHPFTISSAPEMRDVVWLHIRAVGEWTNRLLNHFLEQEKMLKERKLDDDLRIVFHDAVTRVGGSNGGVPNYKSPTDASLRSSSSESLSDDVTFELPQGYVENEFEMTPIHLPQASSSASVQDCLHTSSVKSRHGCLVGRMSTPLSSSVVRDASAEVNGKKGILRRHKSVVYVLPRPDDCDDTGCQKPKSRFHLRDPEAGTSLANMDSAKTVGQISRLLSVKRRPQSLEVTEKEKKNKIIKLERPIHLHLDGPYGSPTSHIFSTQHAVLIATGIGVTPFASILQSIMFRYVKAKHSCPECHHAWADPEPTSMMKLRKVDFVWINRDQKSFEWFVNLLSELEITQAQLNEQQRFLDIHMYITSALDKSDMKAVGLQLALDLMHDKESRDMITGLKTRTQPGRPNWNKFFANIAAQKKGGVTVFFCGPPELGRTLQSKCIPFGFTFRKEIF